MLEKLSCLKFVSEQTTRYRLRRIAANWHKVFGAVWYLDVEVVIFHCLLPDLVGSQNPSRDVIVTSASMCVPPAYHHLRNVSYIWREAEKPFEADGLL